MVLYQFLQLWHRYFVVDNDADKFSYFGSEKADKPKKQMDTAKFECKIEYKSKLTKDELKTWKDKDKANTMRVRISIPKGKKKHRDVYYYTDDLFEAEYLKLEVDKGLTQRLIIPLYAVNQIFKTNICSNLNTQFIAAPERRKNWDKISAIGEAFPDKFAVCMQTFGQKLLDKAKAMLVPKNKWLYDYIDLLKSIDQGKASKKTMREGKVLVDESGLQFINESKPSDNFMIADYDHIHAIICKSDGHR